MKFIFEHLGVIKQATLELAPLTIICGSNNTGKTYVTYAIYALLATWRNLLEWKVSDADIRNLQDNGILKVNLQQVFVDKWDEIKQKTAENWKNFLPVALAAPKERFSDTSLKFELSLTDKWIESNYEAKFTSEQGKVIFTAKKIAGSSEIEIVAMRTTEEPTWPGHALGEFVQQVMLDAVLGVYMPKVFMASAERTGAVIFKDELNLTKNKIVNLLSQLDKDKTQHIAPSTLLNAVYRGGYALPVDSNIRFINQLQSLKNNNSKLVSEYPNLLEDFKILAGGSYFTNKDGTTYFMPSRTTTKLALTEASSSARSLLVLWYWLSNEAAPGDMLMIDEPELNLHPINQRNMARFLAKLVNAKVSVFVTTHSDYIIKEFNTLIMLAQRTEHTKKVQKSYNYNDNELLDPGKVKLYMTSAKNKSRGSIKIETLKPASIDGDRGIEVETFDTTIDKMNTIQNYIIYGGML